MTAQRCDSGRARHGGWWRPLATRGVRWPVVLLLASLPIGAAANGDPSAPGAYCRLPEKGEVPSCLGPAQKEYGAFFAALEQGGVSDDDTARLEASLRGEGPESDAYLALSTLAYGYYRLAGVVAADPQADPDGRTRLEQWNRLISDAYEGSGADPRFREALREAAVDLHERAPAIATRCRDGDLTQCTTTSELMVALEGIDARTGTAGALSRILDRLMGSDP